MTRAFDDALVTDWEPLEGTYGLPDPDDEHVVAAAVVGRAEVIVTSNLSDFPGGLLPENVRAISPQEFVNDTVRHHLTRACRAVLEICDRSGRFGTKLEVADVLSALERRYRMFEAVEVLSGAPELRDYL